MNGSKEKEERKWRTNKHTKNEWMNEWTNEWMKWVKKGINVGQKTRWIRRKPRKNSLNRDKKGMFSHLHALVVLISSSVATLSIKYSADKRGKRTFARTSAAYSWNQHVHIFRQNTSFNKSVTWWNTLPDPCYCSTLAFLIREGMLFIGGGRGVGWAGASEGRVVSEILE